jgi:hypothetical protein
LTRTVWPSGVTSDGKPKTAGRNVIDPALGPVPLVEVLVEVEGLVEALPVAELLGTVLLGPPVPVPAFEAALPPQATAITATGSTRAEIGRRKATAVRREG